MKIGRVQRGEAIHWAILDPERNSVQIIEGAFSKWAPGAAAGERPRTAGDELTLDDVRLLAPVDPFARILGVGMNYQTHISNLGHAKQPAHTLGFMKPHSAVVHPAGEIKYPASTAQLDFEIELVAVVARPLGDEPQASACLLGYTIGNDISARDAGSALGVLDVFGQKALDASSPIGPWITTLDEFGGAGQPERGLTLTVNGDVRQRDNTRNMIFSIDELLNYLDARVELAPADLVFTGTTSGVAKEDGRWLQIGDEVKAEIDGIGTLHNRVGEGRRLSPMRSVGRLGLPTK